MVKVVGGNVARMALVFGGLGLLGSCGDNSSSVHTVKPPPGVTGPTTQEVLAQLASSQPAAETSDLEAIPALGEGTPWEGPDGKKWQKYASGIMISEEKAGTGETPKIGQTVAIAYVGTLPQDDKEFDHSPKGRPLKFVLGTKKIIKGWNIVVSNMKVGGKERVFIPSELAYGAGGSPPLIGPLQALVFEMELVSITGKPVKLPEPVPATAPATGPATQRVK